MIKGCDFGTHGPFKPLSVLLILFWEYRQGLFFHLFHIASCSSKPDFIASAGGFVLALEFVLG